MPALERSRIPRRLALDVPAAVGKVVKYPALCVACQELRLNEPLVAVTQIGTIGNNLPPRREESERVA